MIVYVWCSATTLSFARNALTEAGQMSFLGVQRSMQVGFFSS
jgi:hypothetical protein